MSTLISAAVADPANSRPKKKKSGKSAKDLGPSNPIAIRGNIVEFETGLLGETVDPLTVAPPSANQNSTEQEPARTVKPDTVSFSAEKFEQSSAPCYNGIGSDDIELKQHTSSKIDTSNAGALNGGYSKSGGDGSTGSTPNGSPRPAPSGSSRGGDFSGISKVTTDGVAKTTTTTRGFFSSPENRARSSSTTNSSSSPVGDELKRKASAFGSMFKSKVKSAGESIGELVDKAKEKVDTMRSDGKNNYQLQKEEDTTSSNVDGGNYGDHENPKSSWTEM